MNIVLGKYNENEDFNMKINALKVSIATNKKKLSAFLIL